MLGFSAILLFVAYCAGDSSPEVWGSRVVGKPTGPSSTMHYRHEGEFTALLYTATRVSNLTFSNGNCVVNGTIWGSPCRADKDSINITMTSVNAQRRLEIYSTSKTTLSILSTFFVPYCQFPPPAAGKVDLKTSFPLSRFVRGQHVFHIDFAVQGADSGGFLKANGDPLCQWTGVELTHNRSPICANLVREGTSNLRIFHGAFPLRSDVQWENFVWTTNTSRLSVSVDYMQSGVSPEVAECNQFGRARTNCASNQIALPTLEVSGITASTQKCRARLHCLERNALAHTICSGLVAVVVLMHTRI
ncbi:hypothetical protein TcWFU_004022 [Taenia crassiceps]|uniref:DUF5727 domain-containing protein n=1 Tax=Taenia crassiceps TaxID=6207 RepID=A0ABR4Q849_9CEST